MRDKQGERVSHIFFCSKYYLRNIAFKKVKIFSIFPNRRTCCKKIGQRKVNLLNSEYPKTLQLFRIVQTIVTTKLHYAYQF